MTTFIHWHSMICQLVNVCSLFLINNNFYCSTIICLTMLNDPIFSGTRTQTHTHTQTGGNSRETKNLFIEPKLGNKTWQMKTIKIIVNTLEKFIAK